MTRLRKKKKLTVMLIPVLRADAESGLHLVDDALRDGHAPCGRGDDGGPVHGEDGDGDEGGEDPDGEEEHERGEEAREVELSRAGPLEEEREEGDEGGDPEETARDGQDDA